ncbi:hypothetical protein MSMTP_1931 [Methanosarcina sp. MTP4]|uniref:MAE_28990/MAE_18760 family HEPN-like nuclease n=1 Tax=Methanosarcina sp. MTP4 TaxID=1434100 RepID=UPI000615C1F7|nr:MAE_28990/MAE_18760 family HEPN-like nuclease [Methanosarcina sp. MTP4]AKB25400.1 hypothetical protein MSMTP_1931 [Methanosarcina sp. MTP4]
MSSFNSHSSTEFYRINASYIHFLDQIEEVNSLLDYASKMNTENFRIIWSVASRSAIIMSSGFLEKYLKESFMEFIEQINNMNLPTKYIDEKLLITNKRKTLQVLKLINEQKLNSDYEKIVKIYASSFENCEYKPIFVKESFSITNSNPGKDTIRTMFIDIGIRNIFSRDTFNDLDYVGGVETKLEEFIGLRNSFAHGGSGTTIPSISDAQDQIEFLKKFVYALNKTLDDEILNIELKFHRDYFKTLPNFYEI